MASDLGLQSFFCTGDNKIGISLERKMFSFIPINQG